MENRVSAQGPRPIARAAMVEPKPEPKPESKSGNEWEPGAKIGLVIMLGLWLVIGIMSMGIWAWQQGLALLLVMAGVAWCIGKAYQFCEDLSRNYSRPAWARNLAGVIGFILAMIGLLWMFAMLLVIGSLIGGFAGPEESGLFGRF